MSSNDFKSKYLKYKLKYTKTKNQLGGSIIVQIKTVVGRIIYIECESLDTPIIELKHLIYLKEGNPEYNQRLIYNGKELQNDSLLINVNPNNEAISLSIRFRAFTPGFDKLLDPYYLTNTVQYDYYNNLYQNCIRLYYEHIILEIRFKRLLKSKYELTIDDINSINPELLKLCILGRKIYKTEILKNYMIQKTKLFIKLISEMSQPFMKLYLSKDNHFVLMKSTNIDPTMELLFIYYDGKINSFTEYDKNKLKPESVLEERSTFRDSVILSSKLHIKGEPNPSEKLGYDTGFLKDMLNDVKIISELNQQSIKNIKEIEDINDNTILDCELEEQKNIIYKLIHDELGYQFLDVHLRTISQAKPYNPENMKEPIYKLLDHGIWFYINFIKKILEYLPQSKKLIILLKIFALLNYTEA